MGLTGKAVLEGGKIKTLKYISDLISESPGAKRSSR